MTNLSRNALKEIVKEILLEDSQSNIPIGISNRHIHLSAEDFAILFPGRDMEVLKHLKQPGEFATAHTLTVQGPKGCLKRVRILGPTRGATQVELSKTDARQIGVNAPIAMSGNLSEAADVTLISEDAQMTRRAAIVAKRHIHLNESDLVRFGLEKNQLVKVKINTPERTTIYDDVALRVGKNFVLEMHIDTDEANAANVDLKTVGRFV